MSRRARTTVALTGGVSGVHGGLKNLGHKMSRVFHRGGRKRDEARHRENLAKVKFAEDRSRVDTLLARTGTKKTGEGFLG